MKSLFFIILLIMFRSSLSAENLDGEYFAEDGGKVVISNSMMYYIEHNNHNPLWYNDTLAVCKIEKIQDHFFEINSANPYDILFQDMKVKSLYASEEKDSITIEFIYPYDWNDLIHIIYIDTKEYRYNKKNIRIPISAKRFSFSFAPTTRLPIHTVKGQSYGIVRLLPIPFDIEPNTNRIEISIPALDNHFFERYYVKGEYVFYNDKIIKWKGRTFKKTNFQNN